MFYSPDDQTIVAQCTPSGTGAIALLRVSGIDTFAIVDKIAHLGSDKKLEQLASHTIQYGKIIDSDDQLIDTVLFLLMRAPKTFTGQDTIEITCHNNQFIIDLIIAKLINHGARLAGHGEFTKRAVLQGKMDILQAEAINELINAQTQLALKQSLSQLDGSFSAWILVLEKELLKALAYTQASFEFIDEEMEFGPYIGSIIANVKDHIASIKKTFNQQQHIRQGMRIALIGSVNAGKSSLFNALLNQDRAIVNAQAGTTRDSIEAGLYKNGNYWTLIDTAGLRPTQDSIEQEGIKRSFEQAHKADIIILAFDGSRNLSEQEEIVYTQLQSQYENKIIPVYTKSDLASDLCGTMLTVSSKTKNNIAQLEQAIDQKIAHLLSAIDSPFLLNTRQHSLLLELEGKLQDIQLMLAGPQIAYEILSIHLTEAVAHLAQLTGKTISEAGMDMVFREFCVGK